MVTPSFAVDYLLLAGTPMRDIILADEVGAGKGKEVMMANNATTRTAESDCGYRDARWKGDTPHELRQ
jgi:hypothetical protein